MRTWKREQSMHRIPEFRRLIFRRFILFSLANKINFAECPFVFKLPNCNVCKIMCVCEWLKDKRYAFSWWNCIEVSGEQQAKVKKKRKKKRKEIRHLNRKIPAYVCLCARSRIRHKFFTRKKNIRKFAFSNTVVKWNSVETPLSCNSHGQKIAIRIFHVLQSHKKLPLLYSLTHCLTFFLLSLSLLLPPLLPRLVFFLSCCVCLRVETVVSIRWEFLNLRK